MSRLASLIASFAAFLLQPRSAKELKLRNLRLKRQCALIRAIAAARILAAKTVIMACCRTVLRAAKKKKKSKCITAGIFSLRAASK